MVGARIFVYFGERGIFADQGHPRSHILGSLKRHSGITEKPTRDCVLLYNNVGLGVSNFEGKV